ncbi:MAG TPA: hypothetical protein VK430_13840 [Xanthobacteraceae bacterium]|nr:hypothetical protein [Xanthobacteraceae bacterium]
MPTMLLACRLPLAAGALFGSVALAAAQGSPEARQACTPDAIRLCSEFIPDAELVKSCMLAKRPKLSEACRMAMARVHRAYVRKARIHCGKHHRHCR